MSLLSVLGRRVALVAPLESCRTWARRSACFAASFFNVVSYIRTLLKLQERDHATSFSTNIVSTFFSLIGCRVQAKCRTEILNSQHLQIILIQGIVKIAAVILIWRHLGQDISYDQLLSINVNCRLESPSLVMDHCTSCHSFKD